MVFKNDAQKKDTFADGLTRKILAHEGGLMCVELYFEEGKEVPVHSHVHEQISYVKSGVFIFNIDGEHTELKEGDSVYIASNVSHSAKCVKKGIFLDIFTPQREDLL